MPPLAERSPNKSETAHEYRADLGRILSRSLTPETIDTYADDALNDLIELVENATTSFGRRHKDEFDSKRGLETAAFKHFGLGDVESTLDHIASVSERIHFIDTVIESAVEIDQVIIPPGGNDGFIPAGDGSFEKSSHVPRLKTVLFVLENDFGVDISDPKILEKGKVTPNMIRNEPYWSINVPKPGRTILVCDKDENVTYIFDQSAILESGITSDNLLNMPKSDLNDLISDQPLLGSRLVYSNHFVSRLIGRIKDPSTPDKHEKDELPERSYLYPKAPPNVLSMSGTARELRLGNKYQKVELAITALGQELWATPMYDFGGSKVVPGYTPEQRLAIGQYLIENDLLHEKAPNNIRSLSRFAIRLHVKKHEVEDAIIALGDTFGEVKQYRFHNQTSLGIDPVQRRKIYEYMKSNGKLIPKAISDDRSEKGLGDELGIDKATVGLAARKFRKEIGEEELGETPIKRFGRTDTRSYNPQQQSKLWGFLEFNSSLAEPAPEGIKSAPMISEEIGITPKFIYKAIKELEKENVFGSVGKYKFGTIPGDGYDHRQSELIIQRAISEYIRKV